MKKKMIECFTETRMGILTDYAYAVLLWNFDNIKYVPSASDGDYGGWISHEYPYHEESVQMIIHAAMKIFDSAKIHYCFPREISDGADKTTPCHILDNSSDDCVSTKLCKEFNQLNEDFLDKKYPNRNSITEVEDDNTDPYMIFLDVLACCDIEDTYPKQASSVYKKFVKEVRKVSDGYLKVYSSLSDEEEDW